MTENESYMGKPMGYGTIASNGAAHGTNAQVFKTIDLTKNVNLLKQRHSLLVVPNIFVFTANNTSLYNPKLKTHTQS